MLSVPGKISVHIPSSLCMHLLSTRNNHGSNEWALGAGCFVFRGWMFFFVLRRRGLRLTCQFCTQNMKVQFILHCIWAKIMHVFGPCGIFKTDIMKKHDFFIYFLVTWCAILRTRIKSYQCYSEVWKVSIEWM